MVSEAQLKTAVQEAGLENFLIVGPKALRRARGFVKSSKGARARLRKRRLEAAQQARIRRAQVERRREQTGLAEARAQEIGGLAGQLRSLQEIRLSQLEAKAQPSRIARRSVIVRGGREETFRSPEREAIRGKIRETGEEKIAFGNLVSIADRARIRQQARAAAQAEAARISRERTVFTRFGGVGRVPPERDQGQFIIGATGQPIISPAFAPVARAQINEAVLLKVTGRTAAEQRGFRRARRELEERKERLQDFGNLRDPSPIDLAKEGFQFTGAKLDIKAREAAINFGSFGIGARQEVKGGIGPAFSFGAGLLTGGALKVTRKLLPKKAQVGLELLTSAGFGAAIFAQERQAVKQLESVGLPRAEAVSSRVGSFGANLPFFVVGVGTSEQFLRVDRLAGGRVKVRFNPIKEFKTNLGKLQETRRVQRISEAGAAELQARTSKIPFEDVAPARFNVERVIGGKRVSGKQTLLTEDKPSPQAIENFIGLRPKRFKAAEEKLINQEVADIGGQAELLKAAESPFQTTVTGKPKPSNLEARFFTGRNKPLGFGPAPLVKKQPRSQKTLSTRDILGFSDVQKFQLDFLGERLIGKAQVQAEAVLNAAVESRISTPKRRNLLQSFLKSKRGSFGGGQGVIEQRQIFKQDQIFKPKSPEVIPEPPLLRRQTSRRFRIETPEPFTKFKSRVSVKAPRLTFRPVAPKITSVPKIKSINILAPRITTAIKQTPKIITTPDIISKTDVKLIPDITTVPKITGKTVPPSPTPVVPKIPKTPFRPFSPRVPSFRPVPFPKFAAPISIGGFGGGGRARVGKAGKQKKGFTPTFLALATGTRGASTFRGVKTGLGLRPIPKDFKIKIARLI